MKLCNLDGMSCYGHGWIAWKQTLCDCKVLHDMTTYIKKKNVFLEHCVHLYQGYRLRYSLYFVQIKVCTMICMCEELVGV